MLEPIDRALEDLRIGKFVLIFDDDKREGETDLVMASQFCKPASIRRMRKDGGGLIFLMVSSAIADRLELPFLSDMFLDIDGKYPALKALRANDIPYDTKSSFSVYINHRDTFTGITDNDRSLTMHAFADMVPEIEKLDNGSAVKLFGESFRSPGHVPICVASKNLLNERAGHTELVISLLQMANLTACGSGCEIMGDNGRALSKEKARKYAEENDFVFLEGKDIIRTWKKWSP